MSKSTLTVCPMCHRRPATMGRWGMHYCDQCWDTVMDRMEDMRPVPESDEESWGECDA